MTTPTTVTIEIDTKKCFSLSIVFTVSIVFWKVCAKWKSQNWKKWQKAWAICVPVHTEKKWRKEEEDDDEKETNNIYAITSTRLECEWKLHKIHDIWNIKYWRCSNTICYPVFQRLWFYIHSHYHSFLLPLFFFFFYFFLCVSLPFTGFFCWNKQKKWRKTNETINEFGFLLFPLIIEDIFGVCFLFFTASNWTILFLFTFNLTLSLHVAKSFSAEVIHTFMRVAI